MNRNIVLLPLLASTFAAAPAALAHHGAGQFRGGDVDLTGAVTQVRFVNPHAYIYFDVTTETGETEAWRCELQAGSLLKRAGWTEDLFPIGEEIRVTGRAGTNERTACGLDTVLIPDGRTLDRYGQLTEEIDAAFGADDRMVDGKLDLNGSWAAPQRRVTVGNAVTTGAGTGDSPASGGGMGAPAAGMGAPTAGRGGGDGLPGGITGLTAAGEAAVERYAASGAGNPRHRCAATNVFHDWTFDRHVNEIVQTDDSITLKYGLMDIVRTIHMDMDEHPDNITPYIGGHSIGRWIDDNSFEVDTIGFTEGYLSASAMHSAQFHLSETFTYNAEDQTLTREYSAVDPLYFTGTYAGEDVVYPSTTPFEPYACVELADDFIEPL